MRKGRELRREGSKQGGGRGFKGMGGLGETTEPAFTFFYKVLNSNDFETSVLPLKSI